MLNAQLIVDIGWIHNTIKTGSLYWFIIQHHNSLNMGLCCNSDRKMNYASSIPNNPLELTETQKIIRLKGTFDHPNNPHNIHFKINTFSQHIEVSHVFYDKNFHTFALNVPIVANQTKTFKVKQVKTKQHNLLIGIVTAAVFGVNDAYQQKEAMCYSTYSGDIWQNEEGRASGKKMKDGQMVKVTVDTTSWVVTWQKQGEVMGSSNINENLRGKQLYLAVLMINKNDTVEITFN